MKVWCDPEGDKENVDPAGGGPAGRAHLGGGPAADPAARGGAGGGFRAGRGPAAAAAAAAAGGGSRGGRKRGSVPLADITPAEPVPAPRATGGKGGQSSDAPLKAGEVSVAVAPLSRRLRSSHALGDPSKTALGSRAREEAAAAARRLSAGGGLRACR